MNRELEDYAPKILTELERREFPEIGVRKTEEAFEEDSECDECVPEVKTEKTPPAASIERRIRRKPR